MLTRMSFKIGEEPQFTTPSLSLANGAGSAEPPSRRRLGDVINEAFRIALSRGDVATAEELLNVLEGTYERARVRTPSERRRGDPLLERARRDLEAKKAARYRRY